ncbi:MAG: hypothetical protein LBE46_00440 [Wolbachia pipientis]|nr:hypothetical protein [Wolbachia pipientis]
MVSSQCPDYLDPRKRMMSFQCSFLVIPVPRHWDPGNLTLHQVNVQ